MKIKNYAMFAVMAGALTAAAPIFTNNTVYGAGQKTLTAQSIMVDLKAEGAFAFTETNTYQFNKNEANPYFTNLWDGITPTRAEVNGYPKTSDTTSEIQTSTQPGTETACVVSVTAPDAPAPDATQLQSDNGNGNDWLWKEKCKFLDGLALASTSYQQTLTNSASCSYVSKVVEKKPSTSPKTWKVTTTTVTDAYKFTYNYNITPTNSADYPNPPAQFTAWDLKDSSGSNAAHININAHIAGESVISSKQYARKYSFSLLNSDGTSRVQNLVLTLNSVNADGTLTPIQVANPGSTVVSNTPGSTAIQTSNLGEFIIGSDGALDFFYNGVNGSNGNTGLLYSPGDARTILNTDNFSGNNNGGSDGSALAAAVMDTVGVDIGEGSYTITLTGTVKDNSGTGDLSISVTKNIVVVTPGCGSGTP